MRIKNGSMEGIRKGPIIKIGKSICTTDMINNSIPASINQRDGLSWTKRDSGSFKNNL